ncbi:MAG TPA: FG-GAP-like repeat-containing protein [Polyangia bacterium]
MRVGRRAWAVVVLGLLLGADAWAQGGAVDEFTGSFGTSIPITVPAYHGLEPQLGLSYSSGGGNGFVGVGWSLAGFSTIERASPGRGTPRYDANDIYLLDGEELVPCTALGGTHCTKTQSYARISKNGDNTWTIVQKDGTRSTYAAQTIAGRGDYRWLLASVADVRGNTVSYTSSCDGNDCYPSEILYNGQRVTFFWETRPDPITFATGASLARTDKRLRSVFVWIPGVSHIRAYRLTYTTGTGTGRSVVTAIQQYGKDVTHDGAGLITGGTALPETTLGYTDPAAGLSFSGWYTNPSWAGVIPASASTTRTFTGDFNGDGKLDYLFTYGDGVNAIWYVGLSTGSSFVFSSWYSNPAWAGVIRPGNTATRTFVGDFNGDGKTDFLFTYGDGGNALWYVGLSTGSSFVFSSWYSNPGWAGVIGASATTTQTFVGDFNGDGKTDFLFTYGDDVNAIWYVGLSTGSAFAYTSWYSNPAWAGVIRPGNTATRTFVGDFNGDGKTDFLFTFGDGGNALWYVGLSTGSAFVFTSWYSNPGWAGVIPASATTTRTFVGDFNGDGKTDFLFTYGNAGNALWYVGLSTGSGFVFTSWYSNPGWAGVIPANATTTRTEVGDFDGDGKTDFLFTHGDAANATWWVGLAAPGGADLMTSLATGLGGRTTVAYTPSSTWASTNNPPIVQTVTKITTNDGRGSSAETNFYYQGGLYDQVERRFQGFRYASKVLPCITGEAQCPYTATYFWQQYGSMGKPEASYQVRGDGVPLSAVTHIYQNNGATVPHTSLEAQTDSYVYDGSASPVCPGAGCRRTVHTRGYDSYGNVTQQVNYGEFDASGDEATVVYTFRPNTSLYIVAKPAAVQVFQGVGTGGTLLVESRHVYDANATWDAAPTVGNLTEQQRWSSTTSTYLAKRLGYDTCGGSVTSCGNVTSRTDELGNTDTVTYDGTYRVLPVSLTNALGKTVSSTFDYVLGVELTASNANSQTVTKQYDALGRLTRTDGPLGAYETKAYVGFGNATAQYVETRRPALTGTAERYERAYFDGLGRTYKTVSRGPAAPDIVTEMVYNARGQAAQQSLPYYAGDAVKWATMTYDALDRVTKVTAPDGAVRTTRYYLAYNPADADFSVTRPCRDDTDELSHTTRTCVDAEGRTLTTTEFLGGEARVRFAYDARGELAQVTDASGSVRTITYDSLGRKVSMTDPNAGTWSYLYDPAGRLIQQTDAKAQVTTFAYDAVGRRTQKVVQQAGGTVESTITWGYDQVRTGYFNVGAQTSMTDASGTVTYDHDAAGRMVKASRTIDGTAYTVQRGFGAVGELLWTTLPDGTVIGTAGAPVLYDAAGRVTTIPGFVTGATYNAAGALLTQTNANGTVTTHTYDANRGWLLSIGTVQGAATIQNLAFTRNVEGQVTAVTSPFAGEGWSNYGYDSLHRLTSATNTSSSADNQTFAYTANGNMTSNSRLGTYAYPAYNAARPHAVTTAGANSYSYDANGNLVAGAGRSITWTAENLPATIGTATLTYDGNGMRIKKVVGSTTTIYLGDDYEVTGGTATKYVALAGRVVAKQVGTTKYWLHTDDKGSIQAVTDASGVEVARLKYRPYGERLATGGSHAEARSFLGQRQDESGLVYLHARYYDPALGRFISPDPTQDTRTVGGPNGYAYAANDPVNRVDIDGQFSLKKAFRTVVRIALAMAGAQYGIPLNEHGAKSVSKGFLFTKEGRQEFAQGCAVAAGDMNMVPWVGGVFALPYVANAQAALGQWGQALKAEATYALAMWAITAAVVAGGAGYTGWAYVNAMVGAFVRGFIAGFLIGQVNGESGNRSYFCGMAFGMFCMNLMTMTDGVRTLGEQSGVDAVRSLWDILQKLKTSLQVSSTVTSTARGYISKGGRGRFDHRFDYVGHEGVGGNFMGGPLNGATPWNYTSYLHDMAGDKCGYGSNFGSSLFPFPFSTDIRVYYRNFTGDSY